jgi:hypothetical protein
MISVRGDAEPVEIAAQQSKPSPSWKGGSADVDTKAEGNGAVDRSTAADWPSVVTE